MFCSLSHAYYVFFLKFPLSIHFYLCYYPAKPVVSVKLPHTIVCKWYQSATVENLFAETDKSRVKNRRKKGKKWIEEWLARSHGEA